LETVEQLRSNIKSDKGKVIDLPIPCDERTEFKLRARPRRSDLNKTPPCRVELKPPSGIGRRK
jgi:hypothetical protein